LVEEVFTREAWAHT